MTRPRGGIIGKNATPAASAVNSAASGVWTLREAEALKRAGTWPTATLLPPISANLKVSLQPSLGIFDATTGGNVVTANNSTVKRWEDQSGGGWHVSENTSPPTLFTNVVNGYAALRFQGATHLKTSTNFDLTGDPAFSVFAVYRRTGDDGMLFGWGSVNFALEATGLYDDVSFSAIAFAGGNSFVVSRAPADTWFVFSCIKSAGAINTTISVRRNGASVATSGHSTSTPNIASNPLAVGRWADYVAGGGDAKALDGDIAEFLVYSTALSGADRDTTESYLASKYGITLA